MNSIAKFSITKSTVAKLNDNNAVNVVGGKDTGHVCLNNTKWCAQSNEFSCYAPCNSPDATIGCDGDQS